MDPLVERIHTHLQQVAQEEVPLNPDLVNEVSEEIYMKPQLFRDAQGQPNDEIIVKILPLIIQLLRSGKPIEYTSIVALLEALLSTKSFEQVLSFISIEDLVEGLKGGSSSLQLACVAQLSKADPPDMLGNTPVIEAMTRIIEKLDMDHVATVQQTLIDLAKKGVLIRRRLFSGNCLDILRSMHKGHAILQGRIMTLIQEILPFDDEDMITSDLLQYEPESITNDPDILLVLNKIQFYTTLIENPHKPKLVSLIRPQIDAIVTLFTHHEDNSDVKHFILGEIILFLGALSRSESFVFKDIDEMASITSKYIKGFDDDVSLRLLTGISPGYLAENRPEILSVIPFRAKTVQTLRNLLANHDSYKVVNPTAEKLLILPFLELMSLLVVITSTQWGTDDLLHHWPKVMEYLISNEARQPEAYSLRREVFENLFTKPPDVLSVWYGAVKEGYREIVYGPGYYRDPVAITETRGA